MAGVGYFSSNQSTFLTANMANDDQPKREFERAVDQFSDSMYRVAFRMTGNRELAFELVQETFLHAWKGLDSLRDPSRMRAWIFQILRFQFSKQLRREVRYDSLPDGDAESIAEVADTARLDLQDLVQAALNQLDEEFRMPILLVSMEGIPVGEAAEILELPRGTVLSRLHRGREKLKLLIERSGELQP